MKLTIVSFAIFQIRRSSNRVHWRQENRHNRPFRGCSFDEKSDKRGQSDRDGRQLHSGTSVGLKSRHFPRNRRPELRSLCLPTGTDRPGMVQCVGWLVPWIHVSGSGRNILKKIVWIENYL